MSVILIYCLFIIVFYFIFIYDKSLLNRSNIIKAIVAWTILTMVCIGYYIYPFVNNYSSLDHQFLKLEGFRFETKKTIYSNDTIEDAPLMYDSLKTLSVSKSSDEKYNVFFRGNLPLLVDNKVVNKDFSFHNEISIKQNQQKIFTIKYIKENVFFNKSGIFKLKIYNQIFEFKINGDIKRSLKLSNIFQKKYLIRKDQNFVINENISNLIEDCYFIRGVKDDLTSPLIFFGNYNYLGLNQITIELDGKELVYNNYEKNIIITKNQTFGLGFFLNSDEIYEIDKTEKNQNILKYKQPILAPLKLDKEIYKIGDKVKYQVNANIDNIVFSEEKKHLLFNDRINHSYFSFNIFTENSSSKLIGSHSVSIVGIDIRNTLLNNNNDFCYSNNIHLPVFKLLNTKKLPTCSLLTAFSILVISFILFIIFYRGSLEDYECLIILCISTLLILRYFITWRIAVFPPYENINISEFNNLTKNSYLQIFLSYILPSLFFAISFLFLKKVIKIFKNKKKFFLSKIINFFQKNIDNLNQFYAKYPLYISLLLFILTFVFFWFINKPLIHLLFPLLNYLYCYYVISEQKATEIQGKEINFIDQLVCPRIIILNIITITYFFLVDKGFACIFFITLFGYNTYVTLISKRTSISKYFLIVAYITGGLSIYFAYVSIPFLSYNILLLLLPVIILTFIFYKSEFCGHKNKVKNYVTYLVSFLLVLFILYIEFSNSKFIQNKIETLNLRSQIYQKSADEIARNIPFYSSQINKLLNISRNHWFISQYMGAEQIDGWVKPHYHIGSGYTTQTRDLVILRYVIAELGSFTLVGIIIIILITLWVCIRNIDFKKTEYRVLLFIAFFMVAQTTIVYMVNINKYIFLGQDFYFLSQSDYLSWSLPSILFLILFLFIREESTSDTHSFYEQSLLLIYWLIPILIIFLTGISHNDPQIEAGNFNLKMKNTNFLIENDLNRNLDLAQNLDDDDENNDTNSNLDSLWFNSIMPLDTNTLSVYDKSILDFISQNPKRLYDINSPIHLITENSGAKKFQFNKMYYFNPVPMFQTNSLWKANILDINNIPIGKSVYINGKYQMVYPLTNKLIWVHHLAEVCRNTNQLNSQDTVKTTIDYGLQNDLSFVIANNKILNNLHIGICAANGNGEVNILVDHFNKIKRPNPNHSQELFQAEKEVYFNRDLKTINNTFGNINLYRLKHGPGSVLKPLMVSAISSQLNIEWNAISKPYSENPLFSYAGFEKRKKLYNNDNDRSSVDNISDYIAQSNNLFHSYFIFLGSYSKQNFYKNGSYSIENVLIQEKYSSNYLPEYNQINIFNVNYYLSKFETNNTKSWPGWKDNLGYFTDTTSLIAVGLKSNFDFMIEKSKSPNLYDTVMKIENSIESKIIRNIDNYFPAYILPIKSSFYQSERSSLAADLISIDKNANFKRGLIQSTLGGGIYSISPMNLVEQYSRLFSGKKINLSFFKNTNLSETKLLDLDSSWNTRNIYDRFIRENVFAGMRKVLTDNKGTAKRIFNNSNQIMINGRNFYVYAKTGTIGSENKNKIDDKNLIIVFSNLDLEENEIWNQFTLSNRKIYTVFIHIEGANKQQQNNRFSFYKEIINSITQSDSFRKYFN